METQYLRAFCNITEQVFISCGDVYKMSLGHLVRSSANRDCAFAANNVEEDLGFVGTAVQGPIPVKSNKGLAQAGPHLFIQDHVDGTVLPTGYGTVDISIGADQGMIS